MPAGASDNGDRATPVRSAACISAPPGLTDDGLEWYVPLPGRGQRRNVQPGEHLAPDHPLVRQFPACFAPSAEPVDCWPVGLPDTETRERRLAEQRRLASHNARKVTPCCLRCGAESKQSVVVLDQPQALDFNSELSGLEDHDHAGRARVEARYAAMGRAWQEQQAAAAAAEHAWRAEHQQCPEGTPPLPEPEIPDAIPWVPWRLSTVRTRA